MNRRQLISHTPIAALLAYGSLSQARDRLLDLARDRANHHVTTPKNNPVQVDSKQYHDEVWTDPRRSRALTVRVRFPAGDAPCGLIVFSHGLGGNVEGADAWTQAWQHAGFAVIQPQHIGSDSEAVKGGLRALKQASEPTQLFARMADCSFIVDQVSIKQQSGFAPWKRVNLAQLGLAGHSFGAITTQALAGESPINQPDQRFKAFQTFSPSNRASDPRSAFGGIKQPFLILTGTLDGDVMGSVTGAQPMTSERRQQVYAGLPAGNKAMLVLNQADHYTFAGNVQPIKAGGFIKREAASMQLEAQHHTLTASITADWWRAQLLGDSAALKRLQQPQGLSQGDQWLSQ